MLPGGMCFLYNMADVDGKTSIRCKVTYHFKEEELSLGWENNAKPT